MKNVSKKMIIVCVLAIVSYTVAAIILQFYNGVELSSTLTTCWYTFWTVEIFALMGIKITKVKHQYGEETDDETTGQDV